MKYIVILLFLFSISRVMSQTYPNIDHSIHFEMNDFSEIDGLLNSGLPNKAIAKLLTRQIMAISTQQLKDLDGCYERLQTAFDQSGKEDEDLQQLFAEQHRIFLSAEGPARNLCANALHHWLSDYRISASFSFDQESLIWKLDGEQVSLKNYDISPLRAFYKSEILKNEGDLMRISAVAVYDSADVKYLPTLFDVLAQSVLLDEQTNQNEEFAYFESTEAFSKLKLADSYQLRAKLEVLNKLHKRWDAYAFWVEQRLMLGDANAGEAERQSAMARFQQEVIDYPASNRFALNRAYYGASQGDVYDWKTPRGGDNGFLDAHELIQTAIERHPVSDFTDELNSLKAKIEASSFSFSFDQLHFPTDKMLLKVQHRNLKNVHLQIYKVLQGSNWKNVNDKSPLKDLKLELVQERELNLANDPRMLKHTSDFLVGGLNKTGRFLIIVSPSKADTKIALSTDDWKGQINVEYEIVHLSNLLVRTHARSEGFELLVNHAQTGKPVANAKVKIIPSDASASSRNVLIGKTDETGFYRSQIVGNFTYTVTKDQDSVSNSGYSYANQTKTEIVHRLFTDRSIYRPGQVVYFKTLSFKTENGAGILVPNSPISIRFQDGNTNELYSEKLTSNNLGSASGSFVLPKKGFPLGNVHIYIGTQWVKTIQVEEYKRPTFEVSFDQPKGRVVLGEKLTMEGKVMAYAGYPLAHVEVEINISESRFFPRGCIVLPEWQTHDTTIVVQTDEMGVFSFDYLSDKPKDAYGVYYTFEGIVTDISGEVQSANHALFLGKTAYSIVSKMQDSYSTVEELRIAADVLNGQSQLQKGVKVTFSVQKMKSGSWYTDAIDKAEFSNFSRKEFEKNFPKTRYYADQEDKYAQIFEGVINGEERKLAPQLSAGNYKIDFQTIDELGDTVRTSHTFFVWNPENKKGQHVSSLWVKASNLQPIPGETVEIIVGSSNRKTNLFVAIYDAHGFVSKDYIKLKKRKKFLFSVPQNDCTGRVYYFSTLVNGQVFSATCKISPVDTSKTLQIRMKSIQEPLRPGSKQTWEMEITQGGSNVQDAELLASMYDASLDAFVGHTWTTNFPQISLFNPNWYQPYRSTILANYGNWDFPYFYNYSNLHGNNMLHRFGFGAGSFPRYEASVASYRIAAMPQSKEMNADGVDDVSAPVSTLLESDQESTVTSIRENFNETAFFEPQIRVSDDGKYRWNFTLPDALTRWKLMTLAHTKDFSSTAYFQTFEARKDVLLETFEPRFWKRGDELFWVGKVVNLSDEVQEVVVSLKIQNVFDEVDVSALFGRFENKTIVLQPRESKAVEWVLNIPENGPSLVRFEAEASTADFSDILRKTIPILENKERITLAQNFTFADEGTHKLQIEDAQRLANQADVKSFSVTVQPQPLWSTMLNLTHLMQPVNELNESYFGQWLGAQLAKKILDDNPNMKASLTSWSKYSEDALSSLLEQNNELKALVLSETPWLLNAQSETEALRRLSQLLDDDQLKRVISEAETKLKEQRLSDGSWSWVGKERASLFMTQYFAKGMAQLKLAGIELDTNYFQPTLGFLDDHYSEIYNQLTRKNKVDGVGLGTAEAEWLYIRSQFGRADTDASVYFSGLVANNWLKFGPATQAMLGIWAVSTGELSLADKIRASFEDKARVKKHLGMYWSSNGGGYGWYENNIETHALIIDFFRRFEGKEQQINAMQKWLLQQKRTQNWDTPKSTAMACFALQDFGAVSTTSAMTVKFGEANPIEIQNHSPFFKASPAVQDLVSAQNGAILTTGTNELVFASAQLVYMDNAKNIVQSTGPFRMERLYYRVESGQEIAVSDSFPMKVGDLIRVKLKLISDRDLDFVYIEDPKAAGWEAVQVLSGYHFENGIFYRVNRDAKTEFFIEKLRKGTSLYTYEIKVTAKGSLQVGSAKSSCYYAPGFSANTQGEEFNIK